MRKEIESWLNSNQDYFQGIVLLQQCYGHRSKDSYLYKGSGINKLAKIEYLLKEYMIGLPEETSLDLIPNTIQAVEQFQEAYLNKPEIPQPYPNTLKIFPGDSQAVKNLKSKLKLLYRERDVFKSYVGHTHITEKERYQYAEKTMNHTYEITRHWGLLQAGGDETDSQSIKDLLKRKLTLKTYITRYKDRTDENGLAKLTQYKTELTDIENILNA